MMRTGGQDKDGEERRRKGEEKESNDFTSAHLSQNLKVVRNFEATKYLASSVLAQIPFPWKSRHKK